MWQIRERGVGLLTELPKKDIKFEAFSDRIFKAKIDSYKAIILVVYSPTDSGYSDLEKTTFYDFLHNVVREAHYPVRQCCLGSYTSPRRRFFYPKN